ncbi:hypothetical protein [Komagataeibacter melomenusus]
MMPGNDDGQAWPFMHLPRGRLFLVMAAALVGVNRNTATVYDCKLREIIAGQIAHGAPVSGEIAVDESYFD